MNPTNKALVAKIFADAEMGIQIVQALAAAFGVADTVILSKMAVHVPALTPGGPDEESEYDAAKKKAESP